MSTRKLNVRVSVQGSATEGQLKTFFDLFAEKSSSTITGFNSTEKTATFSTETTSIDWLSHYANIAFSQSRLGEPAFVYANSRHTHYERDPVGFKIDLSA